jgi:hypothetical protein
MDGSSPVRRGGHDSNGGVNDGEKAGNGAGVTLDESSMLSAYIILTHEGIGHKIIEYIGNTKDHRALAIAVPSMSNAIREYQTDPKNCNMMYRQRIELLEMKYRHRMEKLGSKLNCKWSSHPECVGLRVVITQDLDPRAKEADACSLVGMEGTLVSPFAGRMWILPEGRGKGAHSKHMLEWYATS